MAQPVLRQPSMVEVPGSFVPAGGARPPMPRSGTQPLADADPNVSSDALNPTTIVLNFLKKMGAPLNGASIRTALEQNARQPGYIPGLDNNAPSTEAEDQAAMAAARSGGGGRGTSRGGPSNAPPASPDSRGRDAQNTSAQPSPDVSPAQNILLGQPLDQTARAMMPEVPPPPLPLPSTASVPGVPAIPGAPPGTPGAPPVPGAPVSPMEAAMTKAMEPATPAPNPVENVQPIPPEMATRAAGGPATSVPPEVPGDMQFKRSGTGFQVEPTGMTRAIPGAIAGAARGALRGPVGAGVGGILGAVPGLAPYILKNLHLQ